MAKSSGGSGRSGRSDRSGRSSAGGNTDSGGGGYGSRSSSSLRAEANSRLATLEEFARAGNRRAFMSQRYDAQELGYEIGNRSASAARTFNRKIDDLYRSMR